MKFKIISIAGDASFRNFFRLKYKKKSQIWNYLRTKLGSFYYFNYHILKNTFQKSYCEISFKENSEKM